MKKIISLILVGAIACLAFTSCELVVTTESTGTTESTVSTGTTGTTGTTAATVDPNLPADAGFGLDGETATDVAVFKTKVLNDGTVAITGTYADAAELAKIVIPAVIDGKKVTVIAESALATLANLTEIVVSGYVTKIEPYAFRDCKALATVKLPEGVTEIGEGAFSGCSALLSTEFIPSTVTVLGAKAFEECIALEKAIIPDSVKSLGERMFHNCSKLAEVKFPAGITKIPERMFWGCKKLAKTTGYDTLVIPEGVTEIGSYAFCECQQPAAIELPSTLVKIGKNAFDTCRRLKTITIPDSVKSIGDNAFSSCTTLGIVVMPAGADVTIGKDPFLNSANVKVQVVAGSAAEKWCTENGITPVAPAE